MTLRLNGVEIDDLRVNGTSADKIFLNGVEVFRSFRPTHTIIFRERTVNYIGYYKDVPRDETNEINSKKGYMSPLYIDGEYNGNKRTVKLSALYTEWPDHDEILAYVDIEGTIGEQYGYLSIRTEEGALYQVRCQSNIRTKDPSVVSFLKQKNVQHNVALYFTQTNTPPDPPPV